MPLAIPVGTCRGNTARIHRHLGTEDAPSGWHGWRRSRQGSEASTRVTASHKKTEFQKASGAPEVFPNPVTVQAPGLCSALCPDFR
jgi:hypothetical protein